MIEINNLWKSYNSIPVLKGLNLEIQKGEILIILGRSGVGKSVLLRHIMGLEAPDQGSIDVDGVRITDLPQKELFKKVKRFGMLFQGSALFDSLTIEENVGFYHAQHSTMTKNELRESVAISLEEVGLAGFQKKMPSELSGGQKRRAALARLHNYEPEIMLFDEPTTGLDPITAMQINECIAHTHKSLNATSIIVTHDVQSALHLGNRFAIHQDGKIEHVVAKENFFASNSPLLHQFIDNFFTKKSHTEDYVRI